MRTIIIVGFVLPALICAGLYVIHARSEPEPELVRNSRPDLFRKPPPKSGYFTPKTDRLPVKQ